MLDSARGETNHNDRRVFLGLTIPKGSALIDQMYLRARVQAMKAGMRLHEGRLPRPHFGRGRIIDDPDPSQHVLRCCGCLSLALLGSINRAFFFAG